MVQTTMTSFEPSLPRAELRDPVQTVEFMLAGNAYVTFQSRKTGTRFTYHVTQAKSRPGDMYASPHFVSVLVGPDNNASYKFLGTIFNRRGYAHGKRSPIGRRADSAIAFEWIWSKLMRGEMHPKLSVWHEGRCGRCGRRLTVPSSIETGLGPECARRSA